MLEKFSKKLKDFVQVYKKYKPVFILTFCTFLLFFSTLWSPLIYVLYGFTFLFYLTCSFGEFFCYTMYFEMFSGLLPYFLVSVCIGFVINIGRYIYDLVRKRAKFYLIPFVLTVALILIFSLIHYRVDSSGAEQGILFIAILIGFYLAFVYRKEINVKKCFNYLSLGIIVSLLMSLVVYLIPKCHFLVNGSIDYVVMRLKDYVFIFDGINSRCRLLTYHTNHLSMICIFMLSYILYAFLNDKNISKRKYLYFAGVFVISTVIGFLTMSKAFIIMFMLVIIYALICLVIKYKKKSIYFILPVVLISIAICVIFRHKFVEIFERFTLYGDSLWSKITTGRSKIWSIYFKNIGSSFAKLVFGHGLFTVNAFYIGSHNIFVEILYRFGIFGSLMLIALITAYYYESDKKIKLTYKNCLMVIVFFLFGLEEMILSERFVFFLILAIVMLVREEIDETKPASSQDEKLDLKIEETKTETDEPKLSQN